MEDGCRIHSYVIFMFVQSLKSSISKYAEGNIRVARPKCLS